MKQPVSIKRHIYILHNCTTLQQLQKRSLQTVYQTFSKMLQSDFQWFTFMFFLWNCTAYMCCPGKWPINKCWFVVVYLLSVCPSCTGKGPQSGFSAVTYPTSGTPVCSIFMHSCLHPILIKLCNLCMTHYHTTMPPRQTNNISRVRKMVTTVEVKTV